MNYLKTNLFILFVVFATYSVTSVAFPDLTGVWESEVGVLEIRQSGNKLGAKQKDPQFIEELGEYMFIADLSGNKLTGKVATIIDGASKEMCGKNWATWSNLELVVNDDGTLLKGRWFQSSHNTRTKGYPVTEARWKPIVFTRNPLLMMSDEPIKNQKIF